MPRKVGHALGYDDYYGDDYDDHYDDYDDYDESKGAHRSNHDTKGNSRLFSFYKLFYSFSQKKIIIYSIFIPYRF